MLEETEKLYIEAINKVTDIRDLQSDIELSEGQRKMIDFVRSQVPEGNPLHAEVDELEASWRRVRDAIESKIKELKRF